MPSSSERGNASEASSRTLSHRLDVIQPLLRRIDHERRGLSNADIVSYYNCSRPAYKWCHSRAGAMHLSLDSDGTQRAEGLARASQTVIERMDPRARRVLELGFGNGFNLRALAAARPQTRFYGVDLSVKGARGARRSLQSAANIDLVAGDFEALGFADDMFDLVFSVESFCHARDVRVAFAEVRRVLRPGGLFVNVDIWRENTFDAAPAITRRAASITEKLVSIAWLLTRGQWLGQAESAGFEVLNTTSMSSEVTWNLDRFERAAVLCLTKKALTRAGLSLLPQNVVVNIAAGYLLAQSFRERMHMYGHVVLRSTSAGVPSASARMVGVVIVSCGHLGW